jgi:mannose-6-phosphate isomerase-like protein (cupin superfamily)
VFESPTPEHRRFKLFLERDISGTKAVAFGEFILPPKAAQPKAKAFPDTEKVFYVLSGRGKLSIDGVDHEIEQGMALYVAPDEAHAFANTGNDELRLLWFEAPPQCEVGGYMPQEQGWRKILPE